MSKNSNKSNGFMLPLGISLGVAFGIIFDNLAIGICLGVSFGLLSNLPTLLNINKNKR